MPDKTALELATASLERLKETIDRDLKEILAAQKAEACLAAQKRKKAGPIRSSLLQVLPNRKR